MGRVDPIRDAHTLIAVKKILKQMSLREWALFAFGINAALRISDLLALQVGDIVNSDGSIRDELDTTVAKTGRHLKVHLPPNAQDALREYLEKGHPFPTKLDAPLFPANPSFVRHKTADTPPRKPVSRQWVNKVLKEAVERVEPDLNVGSHTMRKTWGYHAHLPLGTIMDKLGHRSPSVTLRYLGINDDEVKRATLVTCPSCLGHLVTH